MILIQILLELKELQEFRYNERIDKHPYVLATDSQ